MSLFRDNGVVLRTYRLGEADKIIVFLTEDHGKVRAVAKGIRRTASRFGARLEPMSHVSLLLWQGRGELDTINQAEVIDHFPAVREDLARISSGLSLLEVTDQLAQERHADPGLHRMLVGALGILADPTRDPFLVAPAFFLKALVLEGGGPILDMCASCGQPAEEVRLVAFTPIEGGVLCQQCRRGRPLGADALALLRAILGGSLGSVLAGPPPPGASEVADLATEAIEAHLDRRLKTVRSTAGL